MELVWQHFRSNHTPSESRAHDLESQLRHIESLAGNLGTEAAVHADEAAAAQRTKASKRERSPDDHDTMDDIKGDGDITPIASEQSEDAAADSARAAGERASPPAANQERAPPVETQAAASLGSSSAPADAAPAVLGPLGTAPYGAQAPSAGPAAAAPLPREQRERSPRRDAETRTGASADDDETPSSRARRKQRFGGTASAACLISTRRRSCNPPILGGARHSRNAPLPPQQNPTTYSPLNDPTAVSGGRAGADHPHGQHQLLGNFQGQVELW
jgi:hypothetical protein